jgi:LacI family transcriptional regulator
MAATAEKESPIHPVRTGPPTLRSVAESAGVHPSTVSRALDSARRHLIAPDVVERIEKAAAALGYRRDIAAAALRTGRTRLIGAIVPDVANPVFGPILSGMETALAADGYSAIVCNAGGSIERALAAAEQLIARRVEGLVLATAELDDPVVSLCRRRGVRVVLVNRAEAVPRAPAVVPDDREGMRLAVRHLAGLGHRRIGHLAGPQNVSTGLWRLQAFREAMAEAGLDAGAVAVAEAYGRDAGQAAAARLLAAHRLTAIAAANDLLALGAYLALAEAGLACPRDVSIVGFNDMPLIDMVDPPLTSIHINSVELGRRAGAGIVAAIAGGDPGNATALVAPSLVARGSTRAAQ